MLSAFGAWTYALAAIGYLALSGLMLASWRGRSHGVWIIAACMVTCCWALLLALQSARGTLPSLLVYVVEMFHDLAWITALVKISASSVSRTLKAAAFGVCALAILAVPAFWLLEVSGRAYPDPTLLLSRSQLVSSLAGLILLEQIYRNSRHTGRYSIKLFVIGIGALFAYDLFLYSQVELLRAIALEAWNSRGLLVALTVPLIAISARRTPDWSLDVFVSRQVVFYSSTFLVVGAYLLVMAFGGYYVRELGGAWGRVGQLVFFAGAVVTLAGLLASGTLRRQAAVFISKHFYRNKYDYRVEWLRFIHTLSSTEEPDVRRTAIRAIAQIFSSPGGILLLREESGRDFVPAAAWPMRLDSFSSLGKVSTTDDLPTFMERTKWIIDLRELRGNPDVYGNVTLPSWLLDIAGLRIVSPMMQLDELVGVVCLYDPPPPFVLTYEDRDLLKTVGRHVATHIAQDDASRKLAESRQFEAYNRLTAFMMHDLKNSAAQLKLIVENSKKHKRNPEFIDDTIATISNTVDRISRLIEQLRGASNPERVEVLNLAAAAQEAVTRCCNRVPVPVLQVNTTVSVSANAERLTSIIEHIVRNAQDATPDEGSVSVAVERAGETAVLSVTDTGSGMEGEFLRDRLFRPFDSTKGSKGMGIGAYQVREYVRALGGTVDVRSARGRGTTFSVSLPCMPAAESTPDAKQPGRLPSTETKEYEND